MRYTVGRGLLGIALAAVRPLCGRRRNRRIISLLSACIIGYMCCVSVGILSSPLDASGGGGRIESAMPHSAGGQGGLLAGRIARTIRRVVKAVFDEPIVQLWMYGEEPHTHHELPWSYIATPGAQPHVSQSRRGAAMRGPERFLVPILSYGPNNEYSGFVESMIIARALNRTLVLPPFFIHYQDRPRSTRHAYAFEETFDPIPLHDFVPIIDLSSFLAMTGGDIGCIAEMRHDADGQLAELKFVRAAKRILRGQDVGPPHGSLPGDDESESDDSLVFLRRVYVRKAWFTQRSDIQLRMGNGREFNVCEGPGAPKDNAGEGVAVDDSESAVDERADSVPEGDDGGSASGGSGGSKKKNDVMSFRECYEARRCVAERHVALGAPYMNLLYAYDVNYPIIAERSEGSRIEYMAALRHLKHAQWVIDAADRFLSMWGSVREGSRVLAVHLRRQVRNDRKCLPNMPSVSCGDEITTDMLIALISAEVAQGGYTRVFLATNARNDTEVSLLRRALPLVRLEDGTRLDARLLKQTSENYAASLVEQAICTRAAGFMGSRLSTWSQFVANQRAAQGHGNAMYIEDSLKNTRDIAVAEKLAREFHQRFSRVGGVASSFDVFSDGVRADAARDKGHEGEAERVRRAAFEGRFLFPVTVGDFAMQVLGVVESAAASNVLNRTLVLQDVYARDGRTGHPFHYLFDVHHFNQLVPLAPFNAFVERCVPDIDAMMAEFAAQAALSKPNDRRRPVGEHAAEGEDVFARAAAVTKKHGKYHRGVAVAYLRADDPVQGGSLVEADRRSNAHTMPPGSLRRTPVTKMRFDSVRDIAERLSFPDVCMGLGYPFQSIHHVTAAGLQLKANALRWEYMHALRHLRPSLRLSLRADGFALRHHGMRVLAVHIDRRYGRAVNGREPLCNGETGHAVTCGERYTPGHVGRVVRWHLRKLGLRTVLLVGCDGIDTASHPDVRAMAINDGEFVILKYDAASGGFASALTTLTRASDVPVNGANGANSVNSANGGVNARVGLADSDSALMDAPRKVGRPSIFDDEGDASHGRRGRRRASPLTAGDGGSDQTPDPLVAELETRVVELELAFRAHAFIGCRLSPFSQLAYQRRLAHAKWARTIFFEDIQIDPQSTGLWRYEEGFWHRAFEMVMLLPEDQNEPDAPDVDAPRGSGHVSSQPQFPRRAAIARVNGLNDEDDEETEEGQDSAERRPRGDGRAQDSSGKGEDERDAERRASSEEEGDAGGEA